jgi:DNA-binding protein Fis
VSGWVRHVEQMLGNMQEGSLEEIDRRGFLKGVGAAAVAGAAGGAKAQEVKFDVAARIAVQKAQTAIGKFFWIRLGGEQSRIMDYIAQNVNKAVLAYCMDTNGYNVLEVIDYATDSAYRAADAVPPSITDRGGAKTAISTANTFMDAYTAAILQKLNEYTRAGRSQQQSRPQQQAQQQRSGAKDIFTPEYANLNLALALYIISKDSSPEIHTQVKDTLNQYIQNNNNKQFVNDAYRAVATAIESSRKRDPEVQARREDSFIKAHRSIIDNLNKSAQKDEFKEGDISQLEKDVAAAPVAPIANMEAQEKIGGRHDADDFDDMVSRLKKLAGSGPMRTVYDPNTRRYKNVPVAQQPGDKK